jgi:hypothetical protein
MAAGRRAEYKLTVPPVTDRMTGLMRKEITVSTAAFTALLGLLLM